MASVDTRNSHVVPVIALLTLMNSVVSARGWILLATLAISCSPAAMDAGVSDRPTNSSQEPPDGHSRPAPPQPGPFLGSVERSAAALREGVLVVGMSSCPAGEALTPVIERLKREFGDTVPFAEANGHATDIPPPYTGIPWTFVVHRGLIVDGLYGALGGEIGERLMRERILHLLIRNGLLEMDARPFLRKLPLEYFRRDLEMQNMSGSDIAGVDLSGRSLVNAQLSGSDLSGANLRGANLNGALLQNAILRGANLEGASVSGASWYHTVCPNGHVTNDRGGACDGL
jgi:hypothetical protein